MTDTVDATDQEPFSKSSPLYMGEIPVASSSSISSLILSLSRFIIYLPLRGMIAPNQLQSGGPRIFGRAANSNNWRVKSDGSPDSFSPRSSNNGSNNYNNRSPFNRGSPQQSSPAITEGRRLYVGNMPYTARKEDVETLFAGGDYQMYDFPFQLSLVPERISVGTR